jgi:hypothetical protein
MRIRQSAASSTHPVTNLRPPAPFLKRLFLPSCRRTKLSRAAPARGALATFGCAAPACGSAPLEAARARFRGFAASASAARFWPGACAACAGSEPPLSASSHLHSASRSSEDVPLRAPRKRSRTHRAADGGGGLLPAHANGTSVRRTMCGVSPEPGSARAVAAAAPGHNCSRWPAMREKLLARCSSDPCPARSAACAVAPPAPATPASSGGGARLGSSSAAGARPCTADANRSTCKQRNQRESAGRADETTPQHETAARGKGSARLGRRRWQSTTRKPQPAGCLAARRRRQQARQRARAHLRRSRCRCGHALHRRPRHVGAAAVA